MRLEVSMIMPRTFFTRAAVALLALFVVACSAVQSKLLSTGMTPDQAVQAMGEPDLKDNIADPNHGGASVLRYVWLEPAAAAQPEPFDPIETPLNYLFFPVKAATIYFGAGLNCASGGGCQKPELPAPSAG